MTSSTRTGKLFAALTARERALLVLRAWKSGGEEDRQVRATMPHSQVAEFNELIEIMNGVNERVGRFILLLRARVEQLGLTSGWLASLTIWSNSVFELGVYIFSQVPEPITESEYRRLKNGRREPRPERATRYEVMPDSKAGEVTRLREDRERIMKAVRQAPWSGLDDGVSDEDLGFGDRIRLALLDRFKNSWIEHYAEMQAIEAFLAEAAEAFDGEDPAIPEVRAIVDWMRPELEGLHADLRDHHQMDIALPELDPERLAVIKKIARWPEVRRGIAQSIHIKLDEAPSGQVDHESDDDPEAAPDAGE